MALKDVDPQLQKHALQMESTITKEPEEEPRARSDVDGSARVLDCVASLNLRQSLYAQWAGDELFRACQLDVDRMRVRCSAQQMRDHIARASKAKVPELVL